MLFSGLEETDRDDLLLVSVTRAADLAVVGSGKIRLDHANHLVVHGSAGTRFTSEIKPNASISLGKSCGYALAEVAEVMSDEELR